MCVFLCLPRRCLSLVCNTCFPSAALLSCSALLHSAAMFFPPFYMHAAHTHAIRTHARIYMYVYSFSFVCIASMSLLFLLALNFLFSFQVHSMQSADSDRPPSCAHYVYIFFLLSFVYMRVFLIVVDSLTAVFVVSVVYKSR